MPKDLQVQDQVDETLRWLERRGTKKNRDGMARYAIVAEKVFGVSVGDLRAYAKKLGRWAKVFDNWAICDTVCLHLFDKTPHAMRKATEWSTRREEFVKRAAFALLASVALHDKKAADAPFLEGLALVEQAANDERNFVKKGVSWALRGIGHRNAKLEKAALVVARRLATSESNSARWIGRDALKDLLRPKK